MKDISNSNFGLLIAYALPGFVVIWGLSGLWPTLTGCGSDANACATIPSLVGFLNSTVAAIAAGMAVSAIRFVVFDTIHSLTGLKRPRTNGTAIQRNLAAVRTVIDHHYRYYQFHSNMLVAGLVAYGAYLYGAREILGVPELLLGMLAVVFWIASRDNLRRYYDNLETIFNTQQERWSSMSNGMGKDKKHVNPETKNKTRTKPVGIDRSVKKEKGVKSSTSKRQ